MSARLRLAPTPSGYLHLGNGVNFVVNALWAERLGGVLTLRIDDLDRARVRDAYLDDIAETLHWLLPDQAQHLLASATRQSRRLDPYERALETLRQNGRLYACTCTRREIRVAQKAAGHPLDVNRYPGTCRSRGLALDTPGAAWRLRTAPGVGVGDFVVRQRDATPAYQLASVVDDVDHGITHVARGEDLRASTAMQQVLAEALTPHDGRYGRFSRIAFHHHDLVLDDAGYKLSKSAGSASLRSWRATDRDPRAIFEHANRLLPSPG